MCIVSSCTPSSEVIRALSNAGVFKELEPFLEGVFNSPEVSKILNDRGVDIDVDIRVVKISDELFEDVEEQSSNEGQEAPQALFSAQVRSSRRRRRRRRPRITAGDECDYINGTWVCP